MRGGGATLLALLVYASAITATPVSNEIQGEYPEDALGNWLENFGTYTFLLDDAGSHSSQGVDGINEDFPPGGDDEEALVLEEDVLLEREEESMSEIAPVSISVSEEGLINPYQDYQVNVESLVAEEGSVFVTLNSYMNKTTCGVGGFSPNETLHYMEHQEHVNVSSIGTSRWLELSQDFWWASGYLLGGGILPISYTPPECGCLMISIYYALPVGNVTLVVGPESYPVNLQTLICIDPAAEIEPDDDEELSDVMDLLYNEELENNSHTNQSSQHLRDNREAGSVANVTEEDQTESTLTDEELMTYGQWAERRQMRKNMKKEARQRIRQAGKKVTKGRLRQQMQQAINERTTQLNSQPSSSTQSPPARRRKVARKQARKAKKQWNKQKKVWKITKPWRRHKKQGKKQRKLHRRNRHRQHHIQNILPLADNEENTIDGEYDTLNVTEDDYETTNATEHQMSEEDAVINHLLGISDKTTLEGEELDETDVLEEPTEGEEAVANGMGHPVIRRMRKPGRKQKKKWRRRGRKNTAKPKPGIKFCCKQGIKHKKHLLHADNSTAEGGQELSCNSTNDIVLTFAAHRFEITQQECQDRFLTCCSNFSINTLNTVKARKAQRKLKRQQKRRDRQMRKHRRFHEDTLNDISESSGS